MEAGVASEGDERRGVGEQAGPEVAQSPVTETTGSIVIDADYGLLRQVVETLAANAVARASRVVVRTSTVDKQARIEVLDDGPGFALEILPHVFDRFRRGDSWGSSGLGLAIALTIVQAHGGMITAGNRPTGGAVVTVSLPSG